MIPKKPSAVIFDFDGVLVDSRETHISAWKYAYRELFDKEIPLEAYKDLTGQSSARIALYLSLLADRGSMGEELLKLKNRYLLSYRGPAIVESASEIFSDLKSRGIPYGICSNASSAFIEKILQDENLEVDIVIGYDRAVAPKPSPDGYIQTAEILGVTPEKISDVVVFEDSAPGLTAAVNANMYAVGVAYGLEFDELMALGAKSCCNSLREVAKERWFTLG